MVSFELIVAYIVRQGSNFILLHSVVPYTYSKCLKVFVQEV